MTWEGLVRCEDPLWTRGFSTLRSDANGIIRVPTGPGFGVDIDPGFLRQATVLR